MRIISGFAGGITIAVPKGETRPTTDRVREAVFSILGDHVKAAKILDLFAGSGALGIEALSRGAVFAVEVESNRLAINVIKQNLEKTKLQEKAKVVQGDVLTFVKRERQFGSTYDLIFADPPYVKNVGDKDWIEAIWKAGVQDLLIPNGLLVVEAQAGSGEGSINDELKLLSRREYGKNAILIYQKK